MTEIVVSPRVHVQKAAVLPDMYKKADINTTGRKITGHSGRVTMCTTLFNAGYQEKDSQGEIWPSLSCRANLYALKYRNAKEC